MREFAQYWKENKWESTMRILWLLTVFSSFWNGTVLSVTVPRVGEIFPFRILLPVTALFYLVWMLRGNDHIWKDSSTLEKWVYALIAVMLIYGAVSLPRALDFNFTFRRLFNLCFDLCFFFLMLRLCRREKWFHRTLHVAGAAVALLMLLGVWDVFSGGILVPHPDNWRRFDWFLERYKYAAVSYTNPNDYTGALMMSAGVLLIALVQKWQMMRKWAYWLITVCFALSYFLLLAAADARLNKIAWFILLIGFALFLLLTDRKRIWIIAAVIVLTAAISFANQYRYIVPPIQEYRAEMEAYQRGELPEKPILHIGNPDRPTLWMQFFAFDKDGEKIINPNASAGMRMSLLRHAFQCFCESRGLGVGLGNTETLAGQRNVVVKWAGSPQQSIHSFVARIIADFGIFALVPLCAIGLLLLKYIVQSFSEAIKKKNKQLAAYMLLFTAALFTYPFTSTAPSDAQDIIAMWIYLAVVVRLSNKCFEKRCN